MNLVHGGPSDRAIGLRLTDRRKQILQRAMERCWANDIITVVAAGNEGEDKFDGMLSNRAPQFFGSPGNALITVGGTFMSGRMWNSTCFDDGTGGSLTVYAQSLEVWGAGPKSNIDSVQMTGTSHAAPAVAGLAAYFASLESLAGRFPPGNVAKTMKDYIIRGAYQRSDDPIPDRRLHAPPAEAVIVPYNGARDGLCSTDSQVRRSVVNADGSTSLVKRQGTGEVLVMEDGNVLAPIWSKSYCHPTATSTMRTNTSKQSATATATEQSTTTRDTPPPPAPTVNINQGILTCESGTRKADDDTGYFGLYEMAAARDAFCGNMTSDSIVFKPGKNEFVKHVYVPPNNIYHRIRVSAKWVAGADSNCQPFDFSRSRYISTDGGKYPEDDTCLRRVDTAVQNCKSIPDYVADLRAS